MKKYEIKFRNGDVVFESGTDIPDLLITMRSSAYLIRNIASITEIPE